MNTRFLITILTPLFSGLLVFPVNLHAQADALPKYDAKLLQEFEKNPDRIITDQKFALALAQNYQIRFYVTYMEAYMKERGIKEVPVPYATIKPIVDSAQNIPHPIMVELILSRFGTTLLVPVILTEIQKYEEKKGLRASMPTQIGGAVSPAVRLALNDIETRISRLQDTGPRTLDYVMMGVAGISLLLSIAALAMRKR